MKSCLVTGGMGFIGSNFIRHLIESNEEVKIVNVDKLTYAGNPENLKSLEANNNSIYKFYKADIRYFEAIDKIVRKEKINYLINFAAESHVDRSIERLNKKELIFILLYTWKIKPLIFYSNIFR